MVTLTDQPRRHYHPRGVHGKARSPDHQMDQDASAASRTSRRTRLIRDLVLSTEREEMDSGRLFIGFDMAIESSREEPIPVSDPVLPLPQIPPPSIPALAVPPSPIPSFETLWASITSSPPPPHLVDSPSNSLPLTDSPPSVSSVDSYNMDDDPWASPLGAGTMCDITYLLATADRPGETSFINPSSAYSQQDRTSDHVAPPGSSATVFPRLPVPHVASLLFDYASSDCALPLPSSFSANSVASTLNFKAIKGSSGVVASRSTPLLARARWTPSFFSSAAFDSPYKYPYTVSHPSNRHRPQQDEELFAEFASMLVEQADELEEQASQLETIAARLRRLGQLRRTLASRAQESLNTGSLV